MSWLMAGHGTLERSRCARMLRVICSGRCRSCSRNSPAVSSLWTDSKLLENISVLLQPPKICTKQRWERIIYAPIPCPAQVFCSVHTWFGKKISCFVFQETLCSSLPQGSYYTIIYNVYIIYTIYNCWESFSSTLIIYPRFSLLRGLYKKIYM